MARPIVIAALLGAALLAAQPTRASSPIYKHCPSGTVGSNDLDAAVAAAWRLIPRLYAFVNQVQGRNDPVTKRNTVVVGVLALSPSTNSNSRDARRFYETARRLCGVRTASDSWAIRIYFGDTIISNTTAIVFVADTSHGWKVWYAS